MKRIAVEEHFHTPYSMYMLTGTSSTQLKEIVTSSPPRNYLPWGPNMEGRTLDLELRIREMDEAGIDIQVLSIAGRAAEEFDAATGIEFARKVNDELYRIIKRYPDRFVGFATIPTQDPKAATAELERAVKRLGFRGTLVNSNTRGEYIDNEKHWCIFEMAEKLGVPVYIHPKSPYGNLMKTLDEYPPLWGSVWGYTMDTGLQAMRLICSGVFDKYPGLKIILGHLGEALPFWRWRIDNRWQKEEYYSDPKTGKLLKTPGQYMMDNFLITTSGVFDQAPFMCAHSVFGADRILFAVDYPYESNKEAVRFMDAVPISVADKEKIYYLNSERLLSL
jgi:predicted TIM-barrel fold metal-dependent hydrolase